MGDGDTLTETFTVTSADGHRAYINGDDQRHSTMRHHRNGDGVDAGEVTEDTSLSTGGTLTISDDDAGEATFTAQTDTAGPYGTFLTSAPMAWTYSLNNDRRSSRAGRTGYVNGNLHSDVGRRHRA
ncbi:VCBS domain-containing protein [Vibrio chagasii]|nr:VCBS domain-containing protein [Vibrio chagasii]